MTTRWLGADDRARTGDLDLGKVALYQLSYVRVNLILVLCRERDNGRSRRCGVDEGRCLLHEIVAQRLEVVHLLGAPRRPNSRFSPKPSTVMLSENDPKSGPNGAADVTR